MTLPTKVTPEHLRRGAYLYVRQSTLHQVQENRESTARQYDLQRRAQTLGWNREQITVIDVAGHVKAPEFGPAQSGSG
jgi:DNA invertase Pin-like site-specific DNA recombinase